MAVTPPKVQFEVRGIIRVRNQLRAAASFYGDTTDRIVERHTKNLAAMFRRKPYPPKRANQKYVRTGLLGRSFRAQKVKATQWRVINRAKSPKTGKEYAAWVIKKGWQNKRYHLKRWWTIDDEAEKSMPTLTKALSAELEKQLEAVRD